MKRVTKAVLATARPQGGLNLLRRFTLSCTRAFTETAFEEHV
ncbi:MAG: hypothetical protein FD187_2265 [bacterium]|nr:MAG: hypothetical protein FD142_2788 [bacterium]KAF0148052.1 MAG: hypothetical protein FD187_2265 [bacterium]KAF0167568.1 MAG: hypothetical protein FD158_2146 [bacterium]TXT17489.1 MAG: hypothetical protein FD132_2437 [bacterium]